jgi:hypothetical protein
MTTLGLAHAQPHDTTEFQQMNAVLQAPYLVFRRYQLRKKGLNIVMLCQACQDFVPQSLNALRVAPFRFPHSSASRFDKPAADLVSIRELVQRNLSPYPALSIP